MTAIILGVLSAAAAVFGAVYVRDALKHEAGWSAKAWPALLGIGFVTNFFDTLGVGSFAPTTALYKFGRLVEDRLIPGTMNVGHTLPVVVQALFFITAVRVEALTLVVLMLASLAGAVFGAGIVARLSVRRIRIGMGIALIAVAAGMAAGQLGLIPAGGEAVGLEGWRLPLAAAVIAVLGALSTIGIGFYAPTMALVYALGLSPRVAFPIMMGACAFLMTGAGARFIREGAYDRKAALGLTVLGIPAVFLAATVVKSLPLAALKWVVVAVILYASLAMFRSARRGDGRRPDSSGGRH
ncbi:MAG TPA: sulfite exporter TauE/SafE family protein [Candidatus Aminicenantes bacterium]|nr:sulfite exporter TauE/SafE family protein [Candidatus Aminicenantes bacterium]HDT13809.1 sulfite exporter TauE/SafE family protein [Candidatus Aminicenantes bacterium]